MNQEEYFKNIDYKEIERYISEKQEENLQLEFKTVNHPDYNDNNRDDDKKNLSKVISGFANSTGGIIIWGVKAQANQTGLDVAKELKPIRELTKFLNTLNRLEGQAVTPIVQGVSMKKLSFPTKTIPVL